MAVRRDEDVGRLDVAVHDALGMGRFQAFGDLDAQLEQQFERERLAVDAVLERLTFQQLHREERPTFVFVDIMNRADVRMIQSRSRLRLALESLQRGSVVRHIFGEKFQSYCTTQLGVFRLINHTHPATTEPLDHFHLARPKICRTLFDASAQFWGSERRKAGIEDRDAAVAAFFSEDADMILGNGPRIVGREAIQEWWAHYFSRIDEERKGTFAIASLRVIAPEVVLINLDTKTAGRRSTGEELPTRLARGTWVAIRQSGEWRISALRAFPAVGEVRFRPGTDR